MKKITAVPSELSVRLKNADNKTLRLIPSAIGAVCFGALLMCFPAQTAQGVRNGLSLCACAVIPSLFPFTVLCSFLIKSGLCDKTGRLLSPVMRRFFGLPGSAGGAVITGLLAGYPVGARMTALLLRNGSISPQDAYRLMLFCVNAGPAFVIGTVGVGFFGSRSIGVIIFASLCLSSIISGFLTRFILPKEAKKITPLSAFESVRPCSFQKSLTDSVADAAPVIISVCSWVLLFACISEMLLILPKNLSGTVLPLECLLEVTNGCKKAAQAGVSAPVIAAVLGWAGVSVQCQVLSFVREAGVPLSVFAVSRAVNAALSAFICRSIIIWFPDETAVFLNNAAVSADISAYSMPTAISLVAMGVLLAADTMQLLGKDAE